MNFPIKLGFVIVFCLATIIACTGGGGGGGGDDDDPICTDADNDGYYAESGCGTDVDCDDGDADINPGATEICNGFDDDCDGTLNEGVTNTYYVDADGDTFGNAAVSIQACSEPSGYVENSDDCDDAAASVFPGATETCGDDVDQDCSGSDLSCDTVDNDGDGFSELDGDCNDGNTAINPGATEVAGDGIDQDCDGSDLLTWYLDSDGDGYGDAATTTTANSQPANYVANNSDCNDGSAAINPEAVEIPDDGTDQNCDGFDLSVWYADDDGDGYGDPADTETNNQQPQGYVEVDSDCDDTSAEVNPEAIEICNAIDDNCNGDVDEGLTTTFYFDGDGDDFGLTGVTTQACDLPETGYADDDGDCDDVDDSIYPGASEITDDGIDQDCDGFDLITWYLDDDGDGYGDPATSATANSQPVGYVADNTDCDDSTDAANPGITVEICNDTYDNDCNTFVDCADTTCTDHPTCNTFTNSLGMTFNLIPAGTFTMGSPDGSSEYPIGSGQTPPEEPGRGSDEAAIEETVSQFYMQTTEVTQGQWNAVMGSNPSAFDNCGDDCPVERVSWNDVQTFIVALNALAEPGNTYRLPTEAEWEYAARAGSTTAFANGGITETDCALDDNLDAMGWYCFNCDVAYAGCVDLNDLRGYGPSCAGTNPVAGKDANAWGLYDMHGNLWEWCQDWYDETETERLIRGGSWGGTPAACRSANRLGLNPTLPGIDVGFRLVVEPPPE